MDVVVRLSLFVPHSIVGWREEGEGRTENYINLMLFIETQHHASQRHIRTHTYMHIGTFAYIDR